MVRSSDGKAHRIGQSCYHLYVPAKVGSDSSFPFNGAKSVETQVDVVSDGSAVMVSDGTIPDAALQEIREVLEQHGD